jgi:hypothetical protein
VSEAATPTLRAGDVTIAIGDTDRERADRILAAQDATVARGRRGGEDRTPMSDVLELTIGDLIFTLPLPEIMAVVPMPRLARLPGAPAACLGAFPHEGRVCTCFDPAPALGVTGGEPPTLAIILRGEPIVALAVAGGASGFAADGASAGGDAITRLAPQAGGGHAPTIHVDRLRDRLLGR